MMSVLDLMRPPFDVLRFLPDTPERHSAAVDRVLVTDAQWRPAGAEPGTPCLAIVPVEGAGIPAEAIPEAMTRLVEQGAAAIALAGSRGDWPLGVRRAARALNVCVLVPWDVMTADGIRQHATDMQVAVLHAQEDQIARLTRLAAQLESVPDKAPARLTRWLAEALEVVEATAVLIPQGGPLPDGLSGNAVVQQAYQQVRYGHAPTANIPGPPFVLLEPAGAFAPYDVLAAISRWEWTSHQVALVRQTARHILYAQRHAYGQRLREMELAVRGVVLRQLMDGDVSAAQQAADQLPSGKLTGRAARVAVLECASGGSRDVGLRAAEQATGGQALVAKCPAIDRHVLIVLPQPAARNDQQAREILSSLTAADGSSIGVSTLLPYYAAPHGYTAARRALATARARPGRLAVHSGGTTLAAELPQELYAAWAARVRAPLATSERIPEDQRARIVRTAVTALAQGTTAAGRNDKVDSSTARRRLDVVMSAMKLDPGKLTHRAVAQLALLAPPADPDSPVPLRPLRILLAHEGPRRWAQEVMRPLDGEPNAWRLLTTWLRCNAETTTTAAHAGLGRNTVTRRLDNLAATLALPLTDPGGGLHEALWALVVLGELHEPLPDPALEFVLQ
jgi:hypothetical protein